MLNEKEILVLNDKKEDITDKIVNIEGTIFFVQYQKNGKKYPYSKNKVSIFKKINVLNSCQIKTQYQVLSNIETAIDFGDYVKVFFKNGTNKFYCKSDIEIEKSILSNGNNKEVFDYLKEMASHLTMSDISKEESHSNQEIDFLKKIYEKINFISETSVAHSFLSGEKKEPKNVGQLFYPFRFNLSQKEAISNAFKNNISVIEGPPGTGKTQTILNIIANALMQNKTIAVISNNNSATDNVYEKLEKEGLSSLAAKLGKEKNRKKFIEENQQVKAYPSSWERTDTSKQNLNSSIVKMSYDVETYLEEKNKIASLEQQRKALKTEYQYFLETQKEDISYIDVPSFNADKLHDYFLYLNHFENRKQFFSRRVQILSKFKYHLQDTKLYQYPIDFILDSIAYHFYNKKIEELEEEIKQRNENLKDLDLKTVFKNYTELSMKLFKSIVYERYNHKRVYYDLKEIKNTEQLIQDYPVILSTTYSLVNSISSSFMFDYIVIDESSQADFVSSFPALCKTSNVVIVGDSKQLPNIVDANRKKEFDDIFKKYNIPEKYNYTKNNLLKLTKELYPEMPFKTLLEHYRCHPDIIGFCNKRFYNNQLIILSENDYPNPIIQYRTGKGNHARKNENSQFNDRQVQVIIHDIFDNEHIDIEQDSLGIITPYKAQKHYLRKNITCENVSIDTVHGFQGREKKTIIFSTVANNITEFLDNPNSINVAISRAIDRFILVTPFQYKAKDNSNIISFIHYINYRNFKVVESKIHSIFDLLYKDYEMERNHFLKTHIPFSKYPSETIAYHTILKILEKDEYQSYKVKDKVYPLNKVVKDESILTEEERAFIHTNSHIDFLIFNQFNNLPVLAIEVDGYWFHNTKRQKIRDQKKNSILKKCEIPLLRLKTNECFEVEKIKSELDKIASKKRKV